MVNNAPYKLLLVKRGLSLAAVFSSFAIGVAVSHAQGLSDVALPPVTRDVTRESGMCGLPRGPTPRLTIRSFNPCSGS